MEGLNIYWKTGKTNEKRKGFGFLHVFVFA
jgi:hypothetical protein